VGWVEERVQEVACVLLYEQTAAAFPIWRKEKRSWRSASRIREREGLSGVAGWASSHLVLVEGASVERWTLAS
jgi:hypothetical protein